MERKKFIKSAAIIGSSVLMSGCCKKDTLKNNQILHTVMFRLKHQKGSQAEKNFLEDSVKILSVIGGVKDFKVLKQIGKKNDFDFALSMIFESQADYDAYNNYPTHKDYVKTRWIPEVEAFLESDFVS